MIGTSVMKKLKGKAQLFFSLLQYLTITRKIIIKATFELFLLISETLQRPVEEPQAKRG